MIILKPLLEHFLSQISASDGSGSTLWEDHYKLCCVEYGRQTFEISGIKFPRGGKGMGKTMVFHDVDENGNEGKRTVYMRDVTNSRPPLIHVGYDPYFRWMNSVDGSENLTFSY